MTPRRRDRLRLPAVLKNKQRNDKVIVFAGTVLLDSVISKVPLGVLWEMC